MNSPGPQAFFLFFSWMLSSISLTHRPQFSLRKDDGRDPYNLPHPPLLFPGPESKRVLSFRLGGEATPRTWRARGQRQRWRRGGGEGSYSASGGKATGPPPPPEDLRAEMGQGVAGRGAEEEASGTTLARARARGFGGERLGGT